MHIAIYLKQLFRKPVRSILYMLVLALLTAFFCTSLNLYSNSRENIRIAADTYTTIAIMELRADVDSRGNIIDDISTAEDYAGYQALTVRGYDLTPIINAPGVIKHDLRGIYGAYSEENIAFKSNGKDPIFFHDVIRFKIVPEEQKQTEESKPWDETPYVDDGRYRFHTMDMMFYPELEKFYHGARFYTLNVTESAAGFYDYTKPITVDIMLYGWMSFSEDAWAALKRLNGENVEKCIIIEPNTEYIVSGVVDEMRESSKSRGNRDGLLTVNEIRYETDVFFPEHRYYYGVSSGESVKINYQMPNVQLFPIYKYEDLLADEELLAQYEQLFRAYQINARSFAVVATNDIGGVPAFHLGNMYMHEGRTFTQDEYDSGAKVCMLSTDLARAQGWQLGDKIDFDFYEYGYFVNGTLTSNTLRPYYLHKDPNEFFDTGEYEIIGIYDVRPITGSAEVSQSTLAVPWNTIYVPDNSMPNAPAEEDRQISGALLTIWIENGQIEPFLEYMDELGLTGQKSGDYEAAFTFYDQGYSRVQPSLEALSGTAELLLILSSAMLLIAALLMAFFYAKSNKQSIGTMRLLGCSKWRSFAAVMLGAIIIVLIGTAGGVYAGHALTQRVAEGIMANVETTPEEFLAFSAFLTENSSVEMEFALQATLKVTLAAGGAALLLFLCGVMAHVCRYLSKEPRELLPRAGE